jgi:hypothetical protein
VPVVNTRCKAGGHCLALGIDDIRPWRIGGHASLSHIHRSSILGSFLLCLALTSLLSTIFGASLCSLRVNIFQYGKMEHASGRFLMRNHDSVR